MNDTAKEAFEVMPLDINIAKMQFNLLKRCESELPENKEFQPINEIYKNEDSRVKISEIRIFCECAEDDKDKRNMIVNITDTAKTKIYKKILCSGSKNDIMEYLKSSDNQLFYTVKSFAKFVSNEN